MSQQYFWNYYLCLHVSGALVVPTMYAGRMHNHQAGVPFVLLNVKQLDILEALADLFSRKPPPLDGHEHYVDLFSETLMDLVGAKTGKTMEKKFSTVLVNYRERGNGWHGYYASYSLAGNGNPGGAWDGHEYLESPVSMADLAKWVFCILTKPNIPK